MSDESMSTVARVRPTPYGLRLRIVVWLAGSALGLGVAALQIRFVPSLEDLFGSPAKYGFQPHQCGLMVLWVATAWLVDKPKFMGWAFPAFFAWVWLWFATIVDGIGV